MDPPNNDRWERRKRYLFWNFLVNPGFELSPIPEEECSSPDSGSLPELVVEPAPDRHDDPPEYYEGLERRMKRYYRQLLLGAHGSDDDTDDTPVHVHNTEFRSVSPIDVNTEDDNMTISNFNKRKTVPTDENSPVKRRKSLTKGAHESNDDISSDFEVNRSMASTSKLDIDTRKDKAKNYSIRETQIITSINSDDDYNESGTHDDKLIDTCATYNETSYISIDDSNKSSSNGAHSESYGTDVDANVNENNQDNANQPKATDEDRLQLQLNYNCRRLTVDEIEEIIDNKSVSEDSTQDFHRVSTTIAQIHEPRPERPQMVDGGSPVLIPRLIRFKRTVSGTNSVGRHSGQNFNVLLPSDADEITKTFSHQSFEDIEPVEMMTEAVETRGNVSWHEEETSQTSPSLAFEAPTSAKKLQDISTDSNEMYASHKEIEAQLRRDDHGIGRISEDINNESSYHSTGFELSPIPEEECSSPDSGSLPELVVKPAPDRHDDPPEYYEGLERRMKQYYRQLLLGAHGSDDDTDDTPVHVHNTEFRSVSPIDVNTEDDNMTISNFNKRKTVPTDENSPVKRRKRLTKGAHESNDDISSDFEVNRSMASTSKLDIDTRKDKAKNDSIRETQIITSINSDDDYNESGTHGDKLIDTCATYNETSYISIDDSNKSSSNGAHSESYGTDVDANVNENNQDNANQPKATDEDRLQLQLNYNCRRLTVDEIEEIIDNKSVSEDSTQDFHRVSTTIAQIHEPRPERPQMVDGGSPVLIPRLIRFKRTVSGTNSVGRHSGQNFNVLLPSDEITKTFSHQSFEDIEPVEMMTEAVETRGNVSCHEEETSQTSPSLAFEAPTTTMPADRDSRQEPHLALKDCTVRLERIPYNTLLARTEATSKMEEIAPLVVLGFNGKIEKPIGTMPADRDSKQQPHLALKDCTVRLERCDAVPTDSQQKRNKVIQHTYVCDTCGKAFDEKVVLVRHIRAHAQEKYPKKSKFDTSKGSKTSKLYSREICNEKFPKKYNVIEHKFIHSGKKPYSCDICRKQFTRKDSLPKHLLIHTGQKPYCCDICKRRFSQKGNLMRHKAFIHLDMISEDKWRMRTMKEMCTICNKPFVNLKTHIVIHTGEKPYFCDICQKQFTQKSTLTAHKRIHTGERPYCCTVCAKTFRKISDLYRHERLHTGIKPYSCEICKRKFRRSHHLLDHKRVHLKPRKKRGRPRKTNSDQVNDDDVLPDASADGDILTKSVRKSISGSYDTGPTER